MTESQAIRVLLVEDNEDDAFLIKRMLRSQQSQQYEVNWIDNGDHAITTFATGEFDVCLLDNRLGKYTGLELLDKFSQFELRKPIILITGQEVGESEIDIAALQAGANDFLSKSLLEANTLKRTIRYALERNQQEFLLSRLGSVVEKSTNEIYIFGLNDRRFLQVNETARCNLGYSMTELEKMSPLDLNPHWQQKDLLRIAKPLLTNSESEVVIETANFRKDGSSYPIEMRLYLSQHGVQPAFFAIGVDLTERREREEQLNQAQRMESVGQLAGGIAHDFNNLLTVISGNLELLRDSIAGDNAEENLELLDEAMSAARQSADLTRRLLAFSRRQMLQPKVVNIGVLVKDMLPLLRRAIGQDVSLETHIATDIYPCKIDPSQLENTILNLSVNARDAMAENELKKLTIKISNSHFLVPKAYDRFTIPSGEYVLIEVTDNGQGMKPDTQKQAFDPFFTTKAVGEGTGLGLSVIYGFVKQSHGYIVLTSELGSGTTFEIYLPHVNMPVEEKYFKVVEHQTRAEPDKTSALSGKILLVEDEELLANMTTRGLTRLGYQVVWAANGDEAVGLLQQHQDFDIVFSDVVMPGQLNGYRLLEQACAMYPNIGMILASGFSEDDLPPSLSGVSFLKKPYRRSEVAELIKKCLEQRSA